MPELPYSKNAFSCHKCPRDGRGDRSSGCPMWWKTIRYDKASGAETTVEACGYAQLPVYLVEVIHAANRPAGEIGAMRGEMEQQAQRSDERLAQGFTLVSMEIGRMARASGPGALRLLDIEPQRLIRSDDDQEKEGGALLPTGSS